MYGVLAHSALHSTKASDPDSTRCFMTAVLHRCHTCLHTKPFDLTSYIQTELTAANLLMLSFNFGYPLKICAAYAYTDFCSLNST